MLNFSTLLASNSHDKRIQRAPLCAQTMQDGVTLMVPAEHLAKVEGRLRQEIADAEARLGLRMDAIRSELLAKIELLRVTVDANIERLRVELISKLDGVRHEVDASRIHVQGEIGQFKVELRMLKWVVSVQFGATLAILFKVFMPS